MEEILPVVGERIKSIVSNRQGIVIDVTIPGCCTSSGSGWFSIKWDDLDHSVSYYISDYIPWARSTRYVGYQTAFLRRTKG